MNLKHALMTAGALSLIGCSSDSEPKPNTSPLEGTWKTACYMAAQTTLVYRGPQLTGTYTEYTDPGCTDARHIGTWTGTATIGAETAPGVRKLDLTFTSFRSLALTDAEAAFVNTNHYCGLSDWAAGVERDILGLDCFGFAIPSGGRSLDIFQVVDKSLRFGKGSKISANPSEADRPTTLDDARVFTRQ